VFSFIPHDLLRAPTTDDARLRTRPTRSLPGRARSASGERIRFDYTNLIILHHVLHRGRLPKGEGGLQPEAVGESLSGTSTRIKLKTACRSCPERCDRHQVSAFCAAAACYFGLGSAWSMSRLVVRSTPHIDLSPVKAAAHSRQGCCSVCLSARRPAPALYLSPLRSRGSWKPSLVLDPPFLAALSVCTANSPRRAWSRAGSCPPTPVSCAVPRLRCCSDMDPKPRICWFVLPIHPRKQSVWVGSLVFGYFSDGKSDRLKERGQLTRRTL
jgi:hypothetical protein